MGSHLRAAGLGSELHLQVKVKTSSAGVIEHDVTASGAGTVTAEYLCKTSAMRCFPAVFNSA